MFKRKPKADKQNSSNNSPVPNPQTNASPVNDNVPSYQTPDQVQQSQISSGNLQQTSPTQNLNQNPQPNQQEQGWPLPLQQKQLQQQKPPAQQQKGPIRQGQQQGSPVPQGNQQGIQLQQQGLQQGSTLPPQPQQGLPVQQQQQIQMQQGQQGKPQGVLGQQQGPQQGSPVQQKQQIPPIQQQQGFPVVQGRQQGSPIQQQQQLQGAQMQQGSQQGSPVQQKQVPPMQQQQGSTFPTQPQQGSPMQQKQQGSTFPTQPQQGSPVVQGKQPGSLPQQQGLQGTPVQQQQGSTFPTQPQQIPPMIQGKQAGSLPQQASSPVQQKQPVPAVQQQQQSQKVPGQQSQSQSPYPQQQSTDAKEHNNINQRHDVNMRQKDLVANQQNKAQLNKEEIPTDKDHLIEYLKEKLSKTDATMTTLLIATEIEREKRDRMKAELDHRKREIDDHKEAEGNHLGGKVQEKMKPSIQRALEDRVLAENEKAQLEHDMNELDLAIIDIDEEVRALYAEKCRKEVEIEDAQYRINDQELIIDDLNHDIKTIIAQNERRDKEIHDLTEEINEMNGVMDMLFDVRNKLNKYHEIETSQVKANSKQTADGLKGGKTEEGKNINGNFDVKRKKILNKEDDFWYSDPTENYLKNPKKPNNDSLPWIPKVQDLNNRQEKPRDSFKSVESKPKTPPFNPNYGKPEYLYRNQEFIDEFAGKNPLKDKKTNQPRKLQF